MIAGPDLCYSEAAETGGQMMSKTSDRKTHWERVYCGKSPLEVSWYQLKPALSLRLIENSGISRDQAIIDVGGGASVLADHLLKSGYRDVSVLDIAASALASARQRLGKMGECVTWHEADITSFAPRRAYRLWHDRAVFHFLTGAADRRKYVAVLKQALPPGGHVVLAAFAIGGPEKCSGLDIVQYDADKLLGELGPEFTLAEQAGELHDTPSGGAQQFSYFRLIRG